MTDSTGRNPRRGPDAALELGLTDALATRFHPDGWAFIAIFAAVTLFLWVVWTPLGVLGVALTVWCVAFFRDPERVVPTREGLVVAPADGTVQDTRAAVPPPDLEMGEEPLPRVSIFMNVFNVHVNRLPVAGVVGRRFYRPGAYLNASLDKASSDNERLSVRLDREDGGPVGVVQIAGLVARRIRCDAGEGRRVATGERYGLIRFGSRLDVYLPPGTAPLVVPGQRTLAGETVIADFAGHEEARHGEVR